MESKKELLKLFSLFVRLNLFSGNEVIAKQSRQRLFKFLSFFVGLDLFAKIAEFLQYQFFRCIELVSLRYVIYILTNRALKTERKTCTFRFFCHIKTPFRSQVQIILYEQYIINNLEPRLGIGPRTSFLPRMRSTTEPPRRSHFFVSIIRSAPYEVASYAYH